MKDIRNKIRTWYRAYHQDKADHIVAATGEPFEPKRSRVLLDELYAFYTSNKVSVVEVGILLDEIITFLVQAGGGAEPLEHLLLEAYSAKGNNVKLDLHKVREEIHWIPEIEDKET